MKLKRQDRYLVGFRSSKNPVYGLEHQANCERYESPMKLRVAQRVLREINKNSPTGATIFKLVPLKQPEKGK